MSDPGFLSWPDPRPQPKLSPSVPSSITAHPSGDPTAPVSEEPCRDVGSGNQTRMMARHHCPLCLGERILYSFKADSRLLYQCSECGILFRSELLKPLPGPLVLTELGFLKDTQSPQWLKPEEKVQRLTALGLLTPKTRVVVFRCEDEEFLDLLARMGVEVSAVESAAGLQGMVRALSPSELIAHSGFFDVCMIFDSLGLNANPAGCLEWAWHVLKDDGALVLSLPSVQSWPARFFRRAWMDLYKPYLYYFDGINIQNLLFRTGFDRVVLQGAQRSLTLDSLVNRLQEFPSRRIKMIRVLARVFSFGPLKRWPVSVQGSHVVLVSQKVPRPARRKLSVIVPVYNEKATFAELMTRLLRKEIPELDREIIIVESHSTDGTREEVERYRGHAEVKIVYEDRPRGKGHAVREGFRHATGDFILIQDADLEYDLDDYDNLVAPLVNGQQAFVIGSRHWSSGNLWKIRQFNDMPATTWLFNAGHIFFLTLFNLLYRQSLKDPFSMFKVFRRDCLYGLHFECNRFDFDHELVIKLIRKGYLPVEIPVNYTARSFSEGKKVRAFRDPLTWLRALVKYRFAPIGSR